MKSKKIWKAIPNYEGIYEASTLGRIKSLRRLRNDKRYYLKERILKPIISSNGYLYVNLFIHGKSKIKLIHHIVAETFLGHKPNGYKIVINHINHIKKDNRLDNINIITNRENTNQSHLKSKSKYVGVIWHHVNKKWMARIQINGARINLGSFDNQYKAHLAYQKALKATLQ